jgi:DnaJ-class molecular chaperone
MSNGLLRATDLDYGTTCPRCAGPKAEQALRCQSCRTEDLRGEEFYAKRTCPDCGGPKHFVSERCTPCEHNRRRADPSAWDFHVLSAPDHPWRRSIAA